MVKLSLKENTRDDEIDVSTTKLENISPSSFRS